MIGGRHTSFSPLDKVEIYDPATNTWLTGPIKPTEAAVMGSSAAFNRCAIHCIGNSGPGTVHEAMVAVEPTATFRNAGSNPASLTITTLPSLGGSFTASVDLTTTGHSMAVVFGFLTPDNRILRGGQVLLVNLADPRGELLNFGAMPGPIATFTKSVPYKLSLCGLVFSMQAVHVFGVTPYALSNAQDVEIGG